MDFIKINIFRGDDLTIYSGNDDQITSTLALGAKGVISILANIMPAQTHEICQSYFEGDTLKSDTLQLKYLELIENLFSDINPIPVKHAMNLMGFSVGKCRLPLCDMEEGLAEQLAVCLKKYHLIDPERVSPPAGTITVKRPQNTLLWRKNH